MFNNLDRKMKVIGYLTFCCGIIATVAMVIVSEIFEDSVLLGLLFIALGLIVSWIGSLIYFALAQTLEDTKAIRDATDNSGGEQPVSKYAKAVKSVEAPAAESKAKEEKRNVPLSKNTGAAEITKAEFIKGALEYLRDEGLLNYTQKNYSRLNEDDKKELADIVTFIENNDAVGLRVRLNKHA